MTVVKAVRVRLLQSVTYGDLPAWPAGAVKAVHPALAKAMVDAGEAEYVRPVRDTTVALHMAPTRYRDA